MDFQINILFQTWNGRKEMWSLLEDEKDISCQRSNILMHGPHYFDDIHENGSR